MAPLDGTHPVNNFGNFELKCSLSANNVIPVHKYVSNKTGLTVVVGEVEGPLVNGYFCLATEAHDDDGLPHTLEHLIFLGSEKYPYKGVLDLLANRCLASGTNAWTDTDHTCYTMTTAGSEGFLSLMPIYLDHILYPTLTDSGYITEVHHVNGEGRDGGVVYTEMQGTENHGEVRVTSELNKIMYPGHCGYKSRTGGVMKNLRESTNNEKVRAYHKQYYRPENLCVIVVGHVKPDQVLKALLPVEETIISKGPRDEFVRPWQTPVPPLLQSADIDVPYPSDEEDNGMVYVGWRGPSVVTEFYKFSACSILLKYLTDTSVSPLPKEFVDITDPFASKVSYSLVENSESLLLIQFENVPKEKLNLVKPKLKTELQNLLQSSEPFDMKRLATVINRHRLESLTSLENSPHESIAYVVIGYMLYGNTIDDLDQRLNHMKDLEKMKKEPQSFWVNLLQEYFVDGPSVTVKGVPSIEEQARLTAEEEASVNERVKMLGSDGLAMNEKNLLDAMAKNDVPPPDDMLTSVPIPAADCIHFHTISGTSTDSSQKDTRFNIDSVPLYMHLDHLNTNFVYMFVLLDTSSVPSYLRPYLLLLLNSVLESPIRRGSEVISHEEVVNELEQDTIASAARVGPNSYSRFNCGPFSTTACLLLQLEPKKYKKGISWIREILYQTVLTEDRVKILAAKIVNNVAEVKRSGNSMVYDIMRGLMFNKESNHYAVSALAQQKFLTEMLSSLNDAEKSQKILRDLEYLREILTSPENMTIHLAANLDMLNEVCQEAAEAWIGILPENVQGAKNKMRTVADWTLLKDAIGDFSCVAGIGSVESSFLCQTTPCIKDFNDADLAPLLVFFQYLTQLEGPMWKQIRGQGLAYSYSIVPRPNEAKLYFNLYRASNVVAAYKEAKNVIENQLGKDVVWEETLFESAKSSLIYEIVHREKCIGDVVAQSLLSNFKGVSHDYNRKLVKLISEVKKGDLNRIGSIYVSPMFDHTVTKTTVVCHPSKVEEVAKGLNGLGLNMKTYSSLEECFSNTW
ncbi:uncharacterized protein C05D11.1-like [Rhodnius prolixus]|uniref:Putative zn2+-dependent endopeptidase insulinase superfamily protein n=1 Tax=Rhodnius neglectus TaxID=72488 RepID=A0A0P4VRP5_9HEMI